MARVDITRFHRDVYLDKRGGKKGARRFLYQQLLRISVDGKTIRCLTLPGPWWKFEKQVIKSMWEDGIGKRPSFIAFERDKKLFQMACAMMPRSNKGLKCGGTVECAGHTVSNGNGCVITNGDVMDYLRGDRRGKMFHFIWLDIGCPLKIPLLNEIMTRTIPALEPTGLLTVDFLGCRERMETVDAIDRFGDRIGLIKSLMVVTGTELVDARRYADSPASPMVQVTIRKVAK